MKKYKVISGVLTSKSGKQFRAGNVVSAEDLHGKLIGHLIRRGKIQEHYEQPLINGKIKLAIVTSVWKRPEIFKMFADGIRVLLESCPEFEISLIVSGSEWLKSKSNCDRNGGYLLGFGLKHYQYIEIPNEPLAAKVNATTYACRNLDVHYVMCMGSDDIMSPDLLNAYIPYMKRGVDFIGVTDGYFYDTVSGKSLYWGGYREPYRKGHTLGAFRALSNRLLSEWNWMPWENKDSHVLDKSMQDKLKITPHTIETFSMKSKVVFGIDIKSSTNMTPFAKWDNSEFIDSEILLKHFPYVRN
jgi:hypothetical protein